MPTVSPTTLTFFKGVGTPPPLVQVVTVTGDNVWITVPDPPPGGSFTWTGTPANGVLLNPAAPAPAPGTTHAVAGGLPNKSSMSIPVTFSALPSTAPVHATMTISMVRNDAARSGVPGFPVTVALEGNVPGVGHGAVKITQLDADPAGLDLPGEFVEIANFSDAILDLQGCSVGDFRTRFGPRELYKFTSSFPLDRISDTGAGASRFLRIFTGPGVAADPAFLQIPLNRGAPVWNNAGDTAWIKNPSGHVVATFVYSPPIGGPGSTTPRPPPVTATVSIPANAGPGGTGIVVATGISVQEGDRLAFGAFGQIWVGHGLHGGESGPNGKGLDPAGIGWPMPSEPPIRLIGRIGSTGPFFEVGAARTFVVDDAEGPLVLGVNDINPGDNWGPGYTCIVTRVRP